MDALTLRYQAIFPRYMCKARTPVPLSPQSIAIVIYVDVVSDETITHCSYHRGESAIILNPGDTG